MAKKHYRAFKKQLELTSPKGTFITNDQKSKLFILSAVLLALVFFKGLFLGYILGKKN
ncbi:hypothetical protein [uncultured Tyzzerella sp.]|uniref:hypothetical protein n=1 Tax=uncultured Tyzzerella sp. TaxID=2321398 RepID=UPI002942C8B2|nr:hypothetical protein [uncultured Tyzzerella sp.]